MIAGRVCAEQSDGRRAARDEGEGSARGAEVRDDVGSQRAVGGEWRVAQV